MAVRADLYLTNQTGRVGQNSGVKTLRPSLRSVRGTACPRPSVRGTVYPRCTGHKGAGLSS